jgi:hypothetical protein
MSTTKRVVDPLPGRRSTSHGSVAPVSTEEGDLFP